VFKSILVAIDGSATSNRALEVAIDMARNSGAALHLIHVVREMQIPLNPGLMDAYRKLNQDRHDLLRTAGEQLLNQATRVAQSNGIDEAETSIGAGDPASAIIDYAAKHDNDLIVIGSRGLGNVESALLGSVSRKVCNSVKGNCLVIK